jgi:DNA-binding NtrC family response regulator
MSTSTAHFNSVPASLDLSFKSSSSDEEIDLIGGSAAMQRLRLQVRRIGPHFRTVLVCGEAGTGKKLVAKALHRASNCAGSPFVTCDAAGMEDTLSGFVVGSGFALDTQDGRIKITQEGTLFLDEIGEIPLDTQGRFLRVLKQYERLHSHAETRRRRDLRVIASTSRDLRCLVASSLFRQDLYQRLSMVEITLPPLRERLEDMPELVKHLLDRHASYCGSSTHQITNEAMERLLCYPWPGNVRELEEVLRKAISRSDSGVLESNHLPELKNAGPTPSEGGADASMRLQDVVEQHVQRVLRECGGNKLRASERLGISRSTLYRMLDAGAAAADIPR